MARVIDAVMRLKDQFSPTLKQISKNIEEQQRANDRMTRSVIKTGKSMQALGETLLPASAGITAFGAYGVKSFGDFEEAMNKVKVKLDESDWGRFDELKEQAKQLSTQYAYSAKEIAEAQENIVAAGWDVNAVLSATPTVMNLAAAAGVDMATASGILTDNMTAFGIEAEKANDFADMIAVTANATNTDIPAMAESYKYCASAARAMGVDLADTSTLVGMLANNGIKGSEAGTGVKDMLERLAIPAHREHLEKLGVTVRDASGNFIGMRSVLDQTRNALQGMDQLKKMEIIKEAFGSTALPSVMALLNQTTEDYDKLNDTIRDSAGTCQQAADIMNGGFNAEMKKTLNTVQLAAMNIGEKLVPYIKIAGNEILYMANCIKALTPEQVDLIIKIAGFIVGLTAFLIIGGKAVVMFGTFARTVNGVAVAIVNAGGLIPLIISKLQAFAGALRVVGMAARLLFMNPIGIAIAVIIGLAYLLYTYWEPVKEFFINLWTGISTAFSNGVAAIKAWMDKIGITEKLQTLIQKIATFIAVCINLFMRFKNAVITVFMAIVSPVITLISTVWNAIIGKTTAGGSTITMILKIISTSFNIMVNLVGVYLNGFLDIVGIVVSGVISVFSGVITFLTGIFTGNWTMAWQGIVEIFSGIFSTIEGICNTVMSTIKAAINEVIKGINSVSVDVPDWVPVVGGQHYQPQIPMLATGTDNWRGGPAMIHDAGPEIVDLPSGTRVIPHDKSMQSEYARGKADGNKGGISVDVYINNMNTRGTEEEAEEFATKIVKKIAQKLEDHAMNKAEGAV